MRRRRSRVKADLLVLKFERSGLRRQAFCVQHGLSVAALDKYRKRFRIAKHPSIQPQLEPILGPQRKVHVAGVENRILPVELVNR